MKHSQRRPDIPIAAVASGGRGMGTVRSWLPASCVAAVQLAIWVYLDRFLYKAHSSPSGHPAYSHSGLEYDVALAVVAFMLIAIVVAPPAAATALAPKRPLLTGLFVASLPGLVASAEYAQYYLLPEAQYALVAAVMLSFVAFVIAVLPTSFIRARLRAAPHQQDFSQPSYGYPIHSTDAPVSKSVWPPPPSI